MAVTLAGAYSMIVEYAAVDGTGSTWRNTYDFRDNLVPTSSEDIVLAILNFAKSMAHSSAKIIKYSVYNWAKGAQIYPAGLPVFTVTTNTPCTGTADWLYPSPYTEEPVGQEVCLRIDKGHLGQGKPGRLFIRNLAQMGDLSSTTGNRWSLTPATPLTQHQLMNVIGNALSPFITGAVANKQLVVVQYSPKHGVVSGMQDVRSMTIIGPTVNKPTRKNKK